MKAVRLHSGPKIKVEDVPEPPVGPLQVRVAIQAAGVCGTDLHASHGRLPVPELPVIMGHEGAGIVECLGEGVEATGPTLSVGGGWANRFYQETPN